MGSLVRTRNGHGVDRAHEPSEWREKAQRIREAVEELRRRHVDFEFDGEMTVDMALDHELRTKFYPFCQLTGPANILLMPALHSANIASKLNLKGKHALLTFALTHKSEIL